MSEQQNRYEIVVLDGYTLNPGDLSWSELEALGALRVYERTPYDQIPERAGTASIVLTNKTVLDAAMIDQLPGLRYIGVLATGYNVIDTAAADARSIVISNIPTYGTQSVAQMVMAQLLTFCHRVQQHSDAVKAGRWTESDDWCFWDTPQIELARRTMGIIGFGRIGHQVGRLAAAFGMKVQAYNPESEPVDDIEDFRWVSLPELFETSDVISLNCPLTPETQGIINRDNLALMKSTAFLLNASRGGLVVDADLAEALNEGRIAGAGLDVLSTEPPPVDNPLLSARNIIITPHIAWATREARQRLMNTAVDNVRAFIAGSPQNVVNNP